jgi:hypothetical protein
MIIDNKAQSEVTPIQLLRQVRVRLEEAEARRRLSPEQRFRHELIIKKISGLVALAAADNPVQRDEIIEALASAYLLICRAIDRFPEYDAGSVLNEWKCQDFVEEFLREARAIINNLAPSLSPP